MHEVQLAGLRAANCIDGSRVAGDPSSISCGIVSKQYLLVPPIALGYGSKHHLVTEAQVSPLALIVAIPLIRDERGRSLSKPANV
ncbi:hypothetical protein [Paraburkholderia strydomiana]|uniref:hypothetical protein n=1 Tax=Paraburkholderia strydomiana TaxID=1245417 RepID=UPI001BE74D1D|nr:hypothetical protein [Paraburkholderia strydomiana]MBT2792801.1 hypothetical protein [Paraburkholderia strydomiana]